MAFHNVQLMFYGDDVRLETLPEETRILHAKPPLPGLQDFRSQVRSALNSPLGMPPLESILHPRSRVTIAFDDPCLPVPLMIRDPRAAIVEELLTRLSRLGIPRDRIRLVCANGLHRKWTLRELASVLGRRVIREMGLYITCHDATNEAQLVHLGTTGAGHDVEVNRLSVDADLLIYVNVNFTTMNGWPKSVLVGLGSWRSIRHHHGPDQWNTDNSIMDPAASPMHAILRDMELILSAHCNVFQIETVINNKVWPFPLDTLMSHVHPEEKRQAADSAKKALFSVASWAPTALKSWVRTNLIRSDYRPVAVNAGEPSMVHERTLEILFEQQNVGVSEQADIVIYGVPNLSPYSALSVFNPILLRSLVMGYLVGLFRGRPLVKKGGVVVALNPGVAVFSRRHHRAYLDFWERDLSDFTDPVRCWEELADSYAENQLYIRLYREEFAYHGAHGLINWAWSGMGLRHVQAVILAGAKEPDTARKIGFIPEPTLERAIARAREMTGPGASIAYQAIPPLFCVDVGPDAQALPKGT